VQLHSSTHIDINTKWRQNGLTIAGGSGQGNNLNQLYYPEGMCTADDESTYIADHWNHRIVEWKFGEKNGQVVAGGNGKGNRADQLNQPSDVIIDKKNDSLIICDYGNNRIVRWPRRNGTQGQTIIADIDCFGLAMDNNGEVYVSDKKKNEVSRWKIGDKKGTVVAGGNETGERLNQLHGPTYICVDDNYSVYISDWGNHRVIKWIKGAKEGIVVAGGQGQGGNVTQLSYPFGVIVDHMNHVYVADCGNHRVMRWLEGSKEGSIVVGGNGLGVQSDQLSGVRDLSFDRHGNLYVVDLGNDRVQKFDINSN
jgi:sugar lactone lactonase YvrE